MKSGENVSLIMIKSARLLPVFQSVIAVKGCFVTVDAIGDRTNSEATAEPLVEVRQWKRAVDVEVAAEISVKALVFAIHVQSFG